MDKSRAIKRLGCGLGLFFWIVGGNKGWGLGANPHKKKTGSMGRNREIGEAEKVGAKKPLGLHRDYFPPPPGQEVEGLKISSKGTRLPPQRGPPHLGCGTGVGKKGA